MFDKTTREKIMRHCDQSLSARGGILSGSADIKMGLCGCLWPQIMSCLIIMAAKIK